MLPLAAFVPLQPPEALQVIGPVPALLQLSVVESPSMIVVLLADNEVVAGVPTVTVTDLLSLPALLEHASV